MLFRLFALVTLSAAWYIRAQVAPLSSPANVDALSKRQREDLQVADTKPGGARMVSNAPRPQSALRAKSDALDRYILADMEARHIPAVVFGVFKDGKILRSGAYGHSNLELECPATTHTVFEIGSVTKQFTATVILQLMEEGKLSLEDPIGRFVDSLPEEWQRIKLRNLPSIHRLRHFGDGVQQFIRHQRRQLRNPSRRYDPTRTILSHVTNTFRRRFSGADTLVGSHEGGCLRRHNFPCYLSQDDGAIQRGIQSRLENAAARNGPFRTGRP